jgi:ADP-ribose pyrophosphatase
MAEEDKKPQAKIVEKKRLYDGFFKIDELTIEADMHGGGTQTVKRLNFERGNAVAVLLYDPKRDEVVLINEVRPAMLARGEYPFSDSAVAGMIDEGETELEAGHRETHEETGQTLQNAKLLHKGAFVSAGGTSEKIALVMGTVDSSKAGGIHGEASEGENIKTVVIKSDEFIARAKDGRLKDMKSLALAFWLAIHRDELRENIPAPEAEKTTAEKIAAVAPSSTGKRPEAEITATKTLYEGFFKIEEMTIEMDKHEGGKQTLKRLNFERGDAVAMLGYDPKLDKVVMINELRSGMLAAGEYGFSETVPAAMLKDGEDKVQAAIDRMDRETGLKLHNPKLLHEGAFVSAGGTSERIALVAGTVDSTKAKGINGRADIGENIKTVVVDADDFIARAEDGRLRDMKSLAFAFWLALNRDELKKEAALAQDAPAAKKIANIFK